MKAIVTVFALFFSLFFSHVASAVTWKNIVVFGDSLSDNGNLYEYMKHRLPMSPPYFKGRFSDGPVWAELLSDLYFPAEGKKHLLDYAFGGAGIADLEDDDELFTLHGEIDSYLLAHEDKANPYSLFIVWIGANNYLALPDEEDKLVEEVNNGIKKELERLITKGAYYIVVVNVPDLGRTPAAKDFDSEALLTRLSDKHNRLLAANIDALQKKYPQAKLLPINVNETLKDMMQQPSKYGFTNITETCYEQITKSSSHTKPSILKIVASIKPTAQPNPCESYLFFDPVHPSARAHRIMAEEVKKVIDREMNRQRKPV